MDAERLENLNAYLISKGKLPKQLNRNFVKSNVKNVKKVPLSQPCRTQKLGQLQMNIECGLKKNVTAKHASKRQSQKPERKSSKENNILSAVKQCRKQNKDHPKPRGLDKVVPKRNNAKRISVLAPATPRRLKEAKSSLPTPASLVVKKLLRRSITTSLCNSEKKAKMRAEWIKTNRSPAPARLNQSLRRSINRKIKSAKPLTRTKSHVPMQRCMTPGTKRLATQDEKQQRLKQLYAWMRSKGRDPSKLCGFIPVKTMLTPVHSPAKCDGTTPKDSTSQWPTLREEDYYDELSVLVKQTMNEAKDCLNRDCSTTDVHSQLMIFKEKVPVAEQHASYWITLALVYDKLGRNSDDILALYEEAMKKQAQPQNDIKTALREYVTSKINEPENGKESEGSLLKECDQAANVGTLNKALLAPELPKPRFVVPMKNDEDVNPNVTTPVSTIKFPLSPLVTASSSSVVKLRMIPKSSPVFKKLIARKALPMDVSAIVTPVRRSKRIEHTNWKYPKELRGHDSCVSTPFDLMQTDANNNETASKDFAFDRNNAFGDEYSDIASILRV